MEVPMNLVVDRVRPPTPSSSIPNAAAGGTSRSIAAPGVVHMGIAWLATVTEAADKFELPAFRMTAVDDATPRAVRYVADNVDRKWLSEFVAGGGTVSATANTSAGGKLGNFLGKVAWPSQPTSAASPQSLKLTLTGLEDIFTLLELQCFQRPELALERIEFGPDMESIGISKPVAEEVRKHWLERRAAYGALVPLIPQLRGIIDEGRQELSCHRALIETFPLPFSVRDWQVRTHVRQPAPAAAQTHSAKIEVLKQYCATAMSMSRRVVEREGKKLELAVATVYELAFMRRAVSEASDTSPSGGNRIGGPPQLSAAGLACLQSLAALGKTSE